MPLNFSSNIIESKKILNSRQERNPDLRRFICFLDFYLQSLFEKGEFNYHKEKRKLTIIFLLYLCCPLSPIMLPMK